MTIRIQTRDHPSHVKKKYARLFDLLGLELDRLSVDEDTLTLVGLRTSPISDLSGELSHNSLVDTLEQDSSGLRCAGFDALGDSQLDWVRVADLQGNKLLAGVGGLDGSRLVLDCSPVSDTDHTQYTDVTFGDTEDVVLDERADGSWGGLLVTAQTEMGIQENDIPHIARW